MTPPATLHARATHALRWLAGDLVHAERPPREGRVADWVFIAPNNSEGWILDAICREIGSRLIGSWQVVYNPKAKLPPARTYFFAHYWNYLDRIKRHPHVLNSRTVVWYTHPREIPYTTAERIDGLNKCTQVIATCASIRDMLIDEGLAPDKVRVVLGGASPFLFRRHARTGDSVVGLASAFYERKNPDVVLDLVRAMPHRRFLLVGKGWEAWPKFAELTALPNFTYETPASYAAYPALYARMDVFVSAAILEGGPIPLLEAMMSNVVPVASRTGFAPDLIVDGRNGFLFDVGAPASAIAPLIDKAYGLTGDVRASVRRYSWRRFAWSVIALGEGWA